MVKAKNVVANSRFISILDEFLNKANEAKIPINQITNDEAIGNAIRWQGYVARDGLGITLIINQMHDTIPINKKTSLGIRDGFLLIIGVNAIRQ